MEIKIDTTCKEDLEKVVEHMKRFCIENFREFKLFIDGEVNYHPVNEVASRRNKTK